MLDISYWSTETRDASNWSPLSNDLYCVRWDVKPYLLTHLCYIGL